MAFTSLTFIAFILGVALLTSMVPTPRGRSWVLLVANMIFIGSYINSAIQILPLLVFLVFCYLVIEGLRRSRSSLGLQIGLPVVIVIFILLKKFSFLDEAFILPFPYLIIGLSYILFRVLHLMVDSRQGELEKPISPINFLNYTCNFLTFVAGPIQRYQDYYIGASKSLDLDSEKVFHSVARLIKGLVKVGVVSAIFKYLFDNMSGRLLDVNQASSLLFFVGVFLAATVFYTIYLYSNFAGYMDMVIGIGGLIGQELPENFNKPFLARSFLDFWSRWHMTLSDWFKIYLFNPLLRILATRFTSPKAGPYLGVIAFFVTFLVMGVWHGTTSVFVVYGLLMGAGASINKLWQVMAVKRLGKKAYKVLCEKTISIYFARGMTFAYFAIAITCLWVDMQQLLWLVQRLGIVGLVSGYLVLSMLISAVFFVWDNLLALIADANAVVTKASSGVVARNLVLGLQILLIISIASFFHKAPEFVYRAF